MSFFMSSGGKCNNYKNRFKKNKIIDAKSNLQMANKYLFWTHLIKSNKKNFKNDQA